MRKHIKRGFSIILLVGFLSGIYVFRDNIAARLFGNGGIEWLSQKLSETLSENNIMIVYDVNTSGIETVKQNAFLLGTVQKVEIPYDYSMHFSVDMKLAEISMVNQVIVIRIPAPVPGYGKLTVDRSNVVKSDFLYPLTTERYSEICSELENKLFAEYSENPECLEAARESAIENLSSILDGILPKGPIAIPYHIDFISI